MSSPGSSTHAWKGRILSQSWVTAEDPVSDCCWMQRTSATPMRRLGTCRQASGQAPSPMASRRRWTTAHGAAATSRKWI
ncbi:unnamed protein product, partial [Symbiodinium sp. CCMP2456]